MQNEAENKKWWDAQDPTDIAAIHQLTTLQLIADGISRPIAEQLAEALMAITRHAGHRPADIGAWLAAKDREISTADFRLFLRTRTARAAGASQ